MRLPLATCFAWTLLSTATLTEANENVPKSYDGHKVVRVRASSARSAPQVRQKLLGLGLQPWRAQDVGSTIDVSIPPSTLAAFEALGLEYQVMHEDLGASIAAESTSSGQWGKTKRQADDLAWYDSYHPYEDHVQYFKDLQALFPNNSKAVSSGTSFEGRDIYGLHLCGAGGPGKPVVLYHGTVHAREWISTMTVEYLTLQLILGYNSGDEEVRYYLDSYDFYIFPVVNPDGFVYTQTTDRLWRKSREPPPATAANQSCIGVDINRNWAYAWAPDTGGSDSDPCSEIYAGPSASSSPENQGLAALVDQLRGPGAADPGTGPGIKLYVDWHSYGQYILSPWGYNETLYPPETGKWARAGALVSEAMHLYVSEATGVGRQTTYTFGPLGAVLYRLVGGSGDYVYAVGGAEFSWLIELPDHGDSGFVLPPEEIRPTVEEIWAGQKEMYYLLDEVFFDLEGPA